MATKFPSCRSSGQDGSLNLSGVDIVVPPPVIKELLACHMEDGPGGEKGSDSHPGLVIAAAPLHDMFLGDALIVATVASDKPLSSSPAASPTGRPWLRCFFQRQSASMSLPKAPARGGEGVASVAPPASADASGPSDQRGEILGSLKSELQSQVDRHLEATYSDLIKPHQQLKLPSGGNSSLKKSCMFLVCLHFNCLCCMSMHFFESAESMVLVAASGADAADEAVHLHDCIRLLRGHHVEFILR